MTFDEWYSTQKHQLGNEQVCRAIWDAAKQDTADIFGSLLQCPCCLEVRECRAGIDDYGMRLVQLWMQPNEYTAAREPMLVCELRIVDRLRDVGCAEVERREFLPPMRRKQIST